MSKKKKSLEELFEETLVPEGEHPYEIPENWCWVRLGSIVSINPTKPKLSYDDDLICSFLPMTMVNEKSGSIIQLEEKPFSKVKKGYTYFEKGDILFAKITPCMENGNTVIAEALFNDFGFGSTEFYVLRASKAILNKYLYYLVRSQGFRNQAKQVMTGAVGQQRVPKSFLENYCFALPPLEVQKEIVDKIEILFSKIDESKELMEEVNETFEFRRSATIEYIFDELCGEEFSVFKLKKCVDSIQYGYTESSSQEMIGPKFLRITDIQNDKVNWETVPYCPIDEKEYLKYKLADDDIVIARTGATTGKSYLLKSPPDAVFASYLIRVRCKETINPQYLWAFMKSPMYWKQIMVVKKGSTQPGANAKILSELDVPVPTMERQVKIVEIVEKMLGKYNHKQKMIDKASMDLDNLKENILFRAFSGKFIEDDLSCQPVKEFLKSILQEKV